MQVWVLIAVLLAPVAACAEDAPPADWADVKAIFDERCVMCHSELGAGLELRLDSYALALQGSSRGPVVIAGSSLLGQVVVAGCRHNTAVVRRPRRTAIRWTSHRNAGDLVMCAAQAMTS